ncbi:GNAT family N-acetyltransferase [Kitasatospora aureofaciens]|uniref:GNAT family N-acetyltransferase n=1 Tax=Kitasatospora aureofaciens TaxID=1894 RepID=UPI000524C3C2|nr:GNAT family N-acetyltransferase [Kitasatospora aureofaciens]HJD85216.1 GNAT family N-acetyltransferase [Kitasatospora aureofaciens]
MTWTLSTSLDDFRSRADAFLAARPAENTVLITIAHRLAEAGLDVFGERPPVFGWWQAEPDGPVGGAFLQTPPFAPRLSAMPQAAAAELAVRLAAAGAGFTEVTGVGGGTEQVRAFAEAWTAATGAGQSVRVEERLYRLGELAGPPRPPAGRHRLAGPADRALAIRWWQEFLLEVKVQAHDVARAVDDRIAAGCLHLWEDAGTPVALAGSSPVLAGMSRIGPVYTPADLRGRGYASAVTAAASAHVLGLGAEEVLLYTDLDNPTSNSIYQQIGYRPVEDCLVLDFQAPSES